jgi:hypothetical protein
VEPVQASPRFSCSGPIFVHYANRRIWETYPIDCTKTLGNIYRNGSQACYPKGKTYRDAQLREIDHSVAVDHMSEHEVACWSEPAGEKCGEGETAGGRQSPRALGYETATSSWRRRLRVAEAPLQENTKPPWFLRHLHQHCF